jgi:hypothetical protein
LSVKRPVRGGEDLRAGANDNAVRLRVGAVAGVAGRVDDVYAIELLRIAARPLLPL